jgi:stage V sporulation protein B
MVQTSFSQIIEQIINASVSILAAIWLMSMVSDRDASTQAIYGAMGSAMGTGAGVLTALLFMAAVYAMNSKLFKRRRDRDKTKNELSYGQVFGLIFGMVTPVLLSTCIYNMSSATNLKLYCHIAEQINGYTEAQATTYYGLFSGKANQITNIPIALATAMSSAVIPTISATFERGEMKSTRRKIAAAIKTTMLISIPSAVGLAVLAKPLVYVLYPQQATLDTVARLLQMLAVSVVFYGLSTLSNAVLQGTGYVNKPVIHAAVALVIQAGVLIVLLLYTPMDLYALTIAAVVYSLCMCILNGISMRNKLGYKQEGLRTFILPAFCSLFMGAAAFAVYSGMNQLMILAGAIEKGTMNWLYNCICLVPSLLVAVIVYFALIIKTGAVTSRELAAMPKGGTLLKAARKLHLISAREGHR